MKDHQISLTSPHGWRHTSWSMSLHRFYIDTQLTQLGRAILSEFGGGNNDNCNQQVDELLKYITASDEWIGWVMWAAGPSTFFCPHTSTTHKTWCLVITVWGVNSPCCGADTGSLEPGNANDLGGQKYVYRYSISYTFLIAFFRKVLSRPSGHRLSGRTSQKVCGQLYPADRSTHSFRCSSQTLWYL